MNRPGREYLRYAHEAAVAFHALDREIAGRTRNVSRGGLCATLTEELAIGTSLEIDLQLVFQGDLQSEPLRLPARVAWCTPIDDHFQVGVRFLAMHEETAADLTMFLRYLEGRTGGPVPATASPPAAEPPAISIDERFG